MFCEHCGKKVDLDSNFCEHCGKQLLKEPCNDKEEKKEKNKIEVGYSSKINDPAFKTYLKNSNRYAFNFSLVLAIIAVVGFYIYGETSYEMENPQALYIGFGIGGMFIAIAILQIIGRKRTKTWDGTVVKKEILDKERRKDLGNNDYYMEKYRVYNVIIKNQYKKNVTIRVEDDDTIYNYYEIGDKVRHHGGLNSYEKFDKTKDSIIFCNACGTLNNIDKDRCHRCNCPLLK